jgi:hypothetical protein
VRNFRTKASLFSVPRYLRKENGAAVNPPGPLLQRRFETFHPRRPSPGAAPDAAAYRGTGRRGKVIRGSLKVSYPVRDFSLRRPGNQDYSGSPVRSSIRNLPGKYSRTKNNNSTAAHAKRQPLFKFLFSKLFTIFSLYLAVVRAPFPNSIRFPH